MMSTVVMQERSGISDGMMEQLGISWDTNIVGVAADDQMGRLLVFQMMGHELLLRHDSHDASVGHVQIFEFDGSVWNQLGNDIDGESIGDQFGWSVSISGDGQTVAIGDTGMTVQALVPHSGHVRAYRGQAQLGSSWAMI